MFALVIPLLLAAEPAREIDLTVDDARGACRVRGEFVVAASPATAWSVVTDYDHIPRFVRSMRASRVERVDGRLHVRQEAVGGLFLFKRRVQVLLEVDEDSLRAVHFRDVLGKDFDRYVGAWEVTPDPAGARVVYRLEASPKTALPGALRCAVLRRTARDLLAEVREEMLRR